MKHIHKTIISVFLILVLASAVVTYAKTDTNDKQQNAVSKLEKSRSIDNEPKEKIPVGADLNIPIEQLRYTDIWTKTIYSPMEILDPGCNDNSCRLNAGLDTLITTRYPSEIILTVSAEARRGRNEPYNTPSGIYVTIDGFQTNPDGVIFAANEEFESHSFTFNKQYLSPGKHIVKVGFEGARGAAIWYRTLTIVANGYGH